MQRAWSWRIVRHAVSTCAPRLPCISGCATRRNDGVGVLLISEDLDEIMLLSDRIGVMSRGRIVAEFGMPADRHAVGRAMVGHG